MYALMNGMLTAHNSPFLAKDNTGLGNVLFQIASVVGLAKQSNRKVYFDNVVLFNKKLNDLFQYDYSKSIFRNCLECSPLFQDGYHTVNEDGTYHRQYNPNLVSFLEEANWNIKLFGHFEVPEYFLHIKNEIQTMFSVDDDSLKKIQELYPDLFDKEKTCISLHFRLIEFTKESIMSPQYYCDGIRYILKEKNIVNPVFFIFSDKIPVIQELYKEIFETFSGCKFIIVQGNLDYIDLWTISLCSHNISSQSTFSFWGAFLNQHQEKIVIVPKDGISFFHLLENNHKI
jgi:hypothetical protein